jgi:hypothetical protein
MRENLSGLAHDALTLAELQVRLLSVDLHDARRGAGESVASLAAGAMLGLGAVPLLLFAAAQGLIEQLEWSPAGAHAAVGVVAAAVAGVLLRLGWTRLIRALATLQRSRAELCETLRWLKDSLRPGGRRAPIVPTDRVQDWLN